MGRVGWGLQGDWGCRRLSERRVAAWGLGQVDFGGEALAALTLRAERILLRLQVRCSMFQGSCGPPHSHLALAGILGDLVAAAPGSHHGGHDFTQTGSLYYDLIYTNAKLAANQMACGLACPCPGSWCAHTPGQQARHWGCQAQQAAAGVDKCPATTR